jgi:Zn-dependent M16 (insulinase) family peptidase
MASIEGSYSVHFAKGIVGWSHSDLAALQLATTILNAQESYLWKNIRGAGLAYGANVQVDEESGFVSFDVYRVRDGYLLLVSG